MSTLSGHHRHIGITMQSPSAASRPNIGEVTYVLYFVGHRATVDEFDASLPSHGGAEPGRHVQREKAARWRHRVVRVAQDHGSTCVALVVGETE